jgi:hypothetical protein
VRPTSTGPSCGAPRITDEPGSGVYRVAPRLAVPDDGRIPRPDLVSFLLEEIEGPVHHGQRLSIAV